MAGVNWVSLLTTIAGAAINFVEQIHGPKQGQTKFGLAVNITQSAAVIAAAAGVVPSNVAGDIAKVATIVQDTFNHLKSTNQLAPAGSDQVAPETQDKQDTTGILD